MGIFKKESKKFECNKNPEDGSVICESFRENPDGTRTPLANLTMQVDGLCNPSIQNVTEHEEGELQELEKKVKGRVVAKCQKSTAQQKPQDY